MVSVIYIYEIFPYWISNKIKVSENDMIMEIYLNEGFVKFFVSEKKIKTLFKIYELVDAINIMLPKRSVYVKDDSAISNKSLFISFILPPKM